MTDEVSKVLGVFRTFTDPETIRRARVDDRQAYARLVREARRMIATWSDANVKPYGMLHTSNMKAAIWLIETLRRDGYAADLHWHGRDPAACVQFALDERDLVRAHHDPRHPEIQR
jgi:hypothetical protein